MNRNLPLVSVIIPAYNAEEYISDAINSVLSQSYVNLEVIVVNDGSEDNTLAILDSFTDLRLKVITINNSGQCAAANKGLTTAKGALIKFLDADDVINSYHIEAMVKVADESEETLVLCKWARFYGSVKDAKFIYRPEWADFTPMKWFNTALSNDSDMLPVWQWLIPRNIIKKSGGWDESLGLGNDFEYTSRLLMAAKYVKFCDEAHLYYRSGLNTNMSVDTSSKTIYSVLMAIDKSKDVMLNRSYNVEIAESFAKKYFTWLVSYYPFLNKRMVKEVEEKIKSLGGAKFNFKWGWKFKLLRKMFGWKLSRLIQSYYYSLR